VSSVYNGRIPSTVLYFAHETAVRRNPHNSSNRDFRITTQLRSYKHAFCQNIVSTIKLLVSIFLKCFIMTNEGTFSIIKVYITTLCPCKIYTPTCFDIYVILRELVTHLLLAELHKFLDYSCRNFIKLLLLLLKC